MATRTVLHIGTMKSGTSHLQSRLFANQEALAGAGILVPGEGWGAQVRAVKDVLAIHRHGPEVATGAWQRLVDEMAAHDGPAVVSMEFLGPVGSSLIEHICGSVTGPEIVITVRDLNRTLVAMWQETVQNGRSWTFSDYLAGAEAFRPRPGRRMKQVPETGRTFWRQQNVVRMARDWSAVAPTSVVTLPPPGAPRTLLWDRFCQVLGVPSEGWAEAVNSNESIGAASVLVLRRLNALLDDAGHRFPAGDGLRKQFLAKRVLAARKAQEPSIGLPVAPWVDEQAALMVRQLEDMDLTLVGDWKELTPVAVPGIAPDEVATEEVLDAALVGLSALVAREIESA
ncbi:MAG TPA: hypothetical protein VD814_08265 [Nocardioides sp.]|nr:hypothetical protein [Nocardioides sp.]